MPTARPRNADLTGRTLTEQQNEHAKELSDRAQEIGLANAAQAVTAENEVLDYTTGQPVIVDAIESPIEVSEEWRVIRTNEDVEDMTFGVGTLYSFHAGQKTKVPVPVADHLEEKGYIWH